VSKQFSQSANPAGYAALPNDWVVRISDVIDSRAAIAARQKKLKNFLGSGAICEISDALSGGHHLCTFGGNGAGFVVAPPQAECVTVTLSRVTAWTARDMNLDVRVGMISITEIRASNCDIQVAYWQAPNHIRYALFASGGLEWT
jgi:hypothetical protein